jgi:hypothetical protein
MSTKSIRAMAVAACLVALLFGAAGCNNDDVFNPPDDDDNGNNTNGGSSSLTSTNSTPADGDATFVSTPTYTANAFGTGFDELVVSEVVGSVGHEVIITWDTTTHAINGVQHAWGPAAGGPTSGFTQCAPGANPCDPAKIAINVAGKSVTLTSLALADAFGGSSASTLNGTATW